MSRQATPRLINRAVRDKQDERVHERGCLSFVCAPTKDPKTCYFLPRRGILAGILRSSSPRQPGGIVLETSCASSWPACLSTYSPDAWGTFPARYAQKHGHAYLAKTLFYGTYIVYLVMPYKEVLSQVERIPKVAKCPISSRRATREAFVSVSYCLDLPTNRLS